MVFYNDVKNEIEKKEREKKIIIENKFVEKKKKSAISILLKIINRKILRLMSECLFGLD